MSNQKPKLNGCTTASTMPLSNAAGVYVILLGQDRFVARR